MTADQGFELHPGAALDISEIWEYIAKEDLLAARRVREDILDAIRKLVPFPNQGHRRTDLTSRPLRFQTVRNYLIAYASEETAPGRWRTSWSPQPPCDCGHSSRKKVKLMVSVTNY